MKTQVVSFVYVNKYVLYNNSWGFRLGRGGGEGIQEYLGPKTQTFGGNLSQKWREILLVVFVQRTYRINYRK